MITDELTHADHSEYMAAVRSVAEDLPESQALTLAYMLMDGDCGTVVLVWGRELGRRLLPALARLGDADCHTVLADAVERCISSRDQLGDTTSFAFATPKLRAMLDWMEQNCTSNERVQAAYQTTGDPAWQLPDALSPLGVLLHEVLVKTYMKHSATLPDELVVGRSNGVGGRMPSFKECAKWLAIGLIGPVVSYLGREFCAHLLVNLEAAEVYELCRTLRTGVQCGKSLWDEVGHMEHDCLALTVDGQLLAALGL